MLGRIFKRYFFAGVAILLPVFITMYVLYFVFKFSEQAVGRYVGPVFEAYLGFTVPGLGIVFSLLVILAAGYLSSVYVGRKLIPLVDWVLTRFPIISTIYPPVRQFSRLVFTTDERKHFNRVVLVPYPSSKSFALGFVTNEHMPGLNEPAGRELLGVLVPFGPTPFTGVLLYFAPTDVIDLELPVDAAIKTIVSAGVIAPDLPASAADHEPIR